MPRLILASGSTNRRSIFNCLHLPYDIVPSNINESSIVQKDPLIRARLLAQAKGEAVLKKQKGVIVSADTFTTCGKKVLEKPQTIKEAKEMLWFISGKQTVNNTGFYYYDPFKKIKFSQTITTKVIFRKFFPFEIDSYVKVFPVTAWAAAYAASELYVMGMVARVDGSLTGLTHGLPLEYLVPLLVRSGFNPYP